TADCQFPIADCRFKKLAIGNCKSVIGLSLKVCEEKSWRRKKSTRCRQKCVTAGARMMPGARVGMAWFRLPCTAVARKRLLPSLRSVIWLQSFVLNLDVTR